MKLVGGKKIKKIHTGNGSAIELRQLHLILFPHNLLSLKHFCFYSFIFLVVFVLCEVCSSFSFFFYKFHHASLGFPPSIPIFKASSSSPRLLSPSAGFTHRLLVPNNNNHIINLPNIIIISINLITTTSPPTSTPLPHRLQ